MSMTARGLGALLGIAGALGIVLPLVAGRPVPGPWGSLLAFAAGVLAGVGATPVVAGLLERRWGRPAKGVCAALAATNRTARAGGKDQMPPLI